MKESKRTVCAHHDVSTSSSCSAAPIDDAANVSVLQSSGANIKSQVRTDSPDFVKLVGRRRTACARLVQLKHTGICPQLALCMILVEVNSGCTVYPRAMGSPPQTGWSLDVIERGTRHHRCLPGRSSTFHLDTPLSQNCRLPDGTPVSHVCSNCCAAALTKVLLFVLHVLGMLEYLRAPPVDRHRSPTVHSYGHPGLAVQDRALSNTQVTRSSPR